MCLQTSSVKPWDSWNWSGDEIIHRPIIRASRLIPSKKKRYDIDIREFLTTRDNAVVAQTLGELVAGLAAQDQALFRSHASGSFDFRADKVVQFVSKLGYRKSANKAGHSPDAWLFPDETHAAEKSTGQSVTPESASPLKKGVLFVSITIEPGVSGKSLVEEQ